MAMQVELDGESNLYTNDNKECTIEKLTCGDDETIVYDALFYWED